MERIGWRLLDVQWRKGDREHKIVKDSKMRLEKDALHSFSFYQRAT
jgi:hypothetical protein